MSSKGSLAWKSWMYSSFGDPASSPYFSLISFSNNLHLPHHRMLIPLSFKYPLEWLLVVVLLLTAKLIEWFKPPFIRAVQLTDPTINFPYIAKQQYSDLKLFSATVFLPFLCICVYNSSWLALNGWRNPKQFFVWHMSLLSFGFAVALNGVSTEFLKTLVGKPRPDFVARCGPNRTPVGALVETAIIVDPLKVCTRPYGDAVFLDGFKSTPSGHSSFALCGLVWLTLYAYGQSRVLHGSSKASQLLLTLPLWFAVQICISRTQDYRHHFKDILLGGLLGGLVGAGTYHWFFPPVISEKCNEPKGSGPPVEWGKEPQNIV